MLNKIYKYKNKEYKLKPMSRDQLISGCVHCPLYTQPRGVYRHECEVKRSKEYYSGMGTNISEENEMLLTCNDGNDYHFKELFERRELVVGDNTQTPSQS